MSIGGFTPEFNEILLTFLKSTSRTIARIDDWIFKTVLIENEIRIVNLCRTYSTCLMFHAFPKCFSFNDDDGSIS